MNKQDFIKWLVKKQREAEGTLCYRFIKIYGNSEDFWSYHKPCVDGFENTISLEIDGKVIYNYWNDENTLSEKEFTYDEFVNINIEEI